MPIKGLESRRMLVATHELNIDQGSEQVYNALDCCVTHEIFQRLSFQIKEAEPAYSFERALQAPVLEMMLRGFRIDPGARELGLIQAKKDLERLFFIINTLAQSVWGKDLNPNSGHQLKDFFYNYLGIEPIKQWIKGELKYPMDRKVIEKIEDYFQARPIASCILAARDLEKQIQVLETEVDPDWRMRTSYNIGGTKSARFSSSKSPTGSGGNLQNVTEILRHILISDPGYKLFGVDAGQSDSRMVGFMCGLLFNDWKYLEACECLTADHEVLTPSGWQDIATKPNTILTWHEGKTTFTQPLLWVEQEAHTLINVESRTLSILATPNHDMPVFAGRFNDKLTKLSLSEIKQKPNYKAPLTGEYTSGCFYEPLAKLFAAFQADGTRDSVGRVHWTFTKQRKIDTLRDFLIEAGLKYSEYKLSNGNTRFYLKQGQGQDNWPKVCGSEIFNWDQTSIKDFCNSHLLWDGNKTGSNWSITSVNKEHLEWLATAYMLANQATSITPHKGIYWELTIKTNTNTQYRSATIVQELKPIPVKVYCPKVPSGFFMVRRNGKIYISGNSGDLHTAVARLTWPDFKWNGDLKKDRKLAEEPFYRHFSRRDLCKRLGHGVNFLGKPPTMSKETHIPQNLVAAFMDRYFGEFDAIPLWHVWTANELQTKQRLTSIHGRSRDFFDRTNADETVRKGLAFLAAAATADNLNLGMWRVWKYMPQVKLLAQVHDAIYFQIKENLDHDEILHEVEKHLKVELTAPNGRKFSVPTDIKSGYNWGNFVPGDKEKNIAERNPKGLRKFIYGEQNQDDNVIRISL